MITTIKIFLASSAELKADREQFEIFINRQNNEYIEHGIFLKLVLWEDFLDAMSPTRLQDEYNKEIAKCDVFVGLFWKKVGQYTEEEFEQAFKAFKANNKPYIYTYFKEYPLLPSQANQMLSVFDFKKKISGLGHFYTTYENIHDLKFRFTKQLQKLIPILGGPQQLIPILDIEGSKIRGKESQADGFNESLGNGVELEMIYIPSGTFMMGSPEGEGDDSEKPQREVIVESFYMSKYLITQEQYQLVMDKNPSKFKGNKRPVECVSWNDAIEFCRRLSERIEGIGKMYFLPSEAEWEYACRAGEETAYYFGENITYKQSNFGRNVGQTTSVDRYEPNSFGLYDMHGNVWELCQDDWHDSYENVLGYDSVWLPKKVIRGGSWYLNPDFSRSAIRFNVTCDDHFYTLGFRVVCHAFRT